MAIEEGVLVADGSKVIARGELVAPPVRAHEAEAAGACMQRIDEFDMLDRLADD